MSKIIKGKCFDKDLNQKEDIDFFLISSKDNIIIYYDDTQNFQCYKRKELIHNTEKFEYYGKEYFLIDTQIVLSKEDYNYLTYRNYTIYHLIPSKKSMKNRGIVYRIEPHKTLDYFGI